jgi:4-diphosphocytidyl-2-C-methyl-D-erythritol kinase
VKNDFEESVFIKYPLISEIKNALYSKGAIYASMSGSGSSVFGLFSYQLDLRNEFKGLTYWAGSL